METSINSIFDFPTQKELLLSLISEELKSHHFFGALRELGLDDAYYHTDLCTLILTYLRLSPESNIILDFYFQLLDKYSQHLPPNSVSLHSAAQKVYEELMTFKQKINHSLI